MQVTPMKDRGQELPAPEGRVIGFVNSRADLESVLQALRSAGYGDSQFTVLAGEDGKHLLERLHEKFFFSDPEYQVIEFGLKELDAGHFSLGIEVEDRDEAAKITDLATSRGGHSFQYIGVWVSERLSK